MSGDSDMTCQQMRDERDRANTERMIYDERRIKFANLRATDFSSNKDIIMPGPVKIRDELIIQQKKEKHIDTVKEYMLTNCDRKGVINQSENLTDRERKGRDQIMRGIANQGWMLYNTDKSGKLCLDTVANYKECMASHVANDPIVSAKTVRDGELLLNNHARQWVKIVNIGEAHGHMWRVNRALVSNYVTIPPLMGLRKDHKGDIDSNPVKGPKLRPLCSANVLPNAAFGSLMAKIAKASGDEF